MLNSTRTYTREVNLGHRKVSSEINNEHLEELLENGRNLRKSNNYPINCRVQLNRVWRMSNEQIETINRNRKRYAQEGTLPPKVPLEVSDPYHRHWDPYFAMIPNGGISKRGYVKEVWIEYYIDSIKIGNQSYDVIDPYVHDTEQWIQGFMLDATDLIKLLPSPKIVVRYFRKSE